MPRPGYGSVSLPEGFLKEIDKFLKELKEHDINLGYNGRADFLKDGARELMSKIRTTRLLGVREE